MSELPIVDEKTSVRASHIDIEVQSSPLREEYNSNKVPEIPIVNEKTSSRASQIESEVQSSPLREEFN